MKMTKNDKYYVIVSTAKPSPYLDPSPYFDAWLKAMYSKDYAEAVTKRRSQKVGYIQWEEVDD